MVKLKPSFWVLLFSITLLSMQFRNSFGSESTTKEAYVTLLYGDEFSLGSKKDMVVLVSDGVSEYSKKLLKADGWKVEKISLLANPNQVHPKRDSGVKQVKTLSSYTGGDQGFLNSYYPDFPNARVFDPTLST